MRRAPQTSQLFGMVLVAASLLVSWFAWIAAASDLLR